MIAHITGHLKLLTQSKLMQIWADKLSKVCKNQTFSQ